MTSKDAQTPDLQRTLGVFSASTLIIGSMIGSAIFIAPSIMASYIATPGVYLGLWILGGALTLFGALAYAELCAMLPHAGGQYVFLREAFGKPVAFLYGWTLLLVIQTGFCAAVGIAFAKFLAGVGLPIGETHVVFRVGALAISSAQLVAVAVIAVLTWVNYRGVESGAAVQNVFTVAKLAAVLALIALGFASGKGSFRNFTPVLGTAVGQAGVQLGFLAAAGVAMSKALFAYDAWNTVTFAAEEIRDPERNLPRALIWGTVLTTVAYVGAAAVYLYLLPLSQMARVHENRVAADAAGIVLGHRGVVLVSVAILISTFGCLNGLILGGARVLFAMARDGLMFPSARQVHPRFRTPSVALVVQAIWSGVLAMSGSYSALLTYVTFASLAFNALTVVGLMRLRRTRPDAVRPYRTWGYPVTPLLYLLGAGFFMFYIFVGDLRDALAGVGLVALGIPAYMVMSRR